uniref:NADH-ubiquinone oxidoreductase chain 4L n=1 Tax=Hydra sinensis TaxID=570418 RepID=R4IXA3_9CNID|nr:NADH dehydrogenase subunit 4L [Hydra sinensis]AGE65904.1 NADH dehydrogenase subunit 4L [Hydra sinensis]
MNFNLDTFALSIFFIAIIGIIINRSNIILILISIEILLLSLSVYFIFISFDNLLMEGQNIIIYIITIAAIESAIGLSIIISFYKIKGSISLKFLNLLKG